VEDSSEIKIRLLLKLQDGKLRKFYFFKRKDNDFYWGSSSKSGHHIIPFEETRSFNFQIPRDLDLREKASSKYSFHESGIVHHKTYFKNKTENERLTQWCTLNEITEPKGFFAVISKDVSLYEAFTKSNPGSSGTIPVIFNLPNVELGTRLYFEFFLSPYPDISANAPIIKINGLAFYTISVGINEKMFLIMRVSRIHLPEQFPTERELSIFIN
jgi:hypothetical protein